MKLIWGLLFTVFIIAASLSFAWAGSLGWRRKATALQLRFAWVSLACQVAGIFCGAAFLGHYERIFGAFGNLHSILSRELTAVTVALLIICVFLAQSRRDDSQSRLFPVVAILTGVILFATTVQLFVFWTMPRQKIGPAYSSVPGEHLVATLVPIALQNDVSRW
ncbi:MAG: hypothetical protein P4M01_07260 [Acidobacteriota bacterium]|nr:hypothetical protein [Acidobacteriota bacterium]